MSNIKTYYAVYISHALRAIFPSQQQAEAYSRIVRRHDDDIAIVPHSCIEHPRNASGYFGGLVLTQEND